MDPGIALLILAVVGLPIALASWLTARALRTKSSLEEISTRLRLLEEEMDRLKYRNQPTPAPLVLPEIIVPAPPVREPVLPPPPPAAPAPAPPIFVPPIPPAPALAPILPIKSKPPVNWEQFMGVKGFAWMGGFALFLGVAFFVKYSFDNNLVPPVLRVATGFLTGLGLLTGGVIMSRKNFSALSQTLCATGVLILYAVTFACRSIYHFEFFGPVPTFLLMALITTTAFFLADRLNAIVVAILGMVGGFLTPVLLSTGQDNPAGLFGYIAILDVGLIVVALHRRWFFLTALAALGTAALEAGWANKFFVSEKYFAGGKIFIPLGVLLGFNVLWLGTNWWTKRRQPAPGQFSSSLWLSGSALGLVAVALALSAWFLDFEPLAQQPWLMFGFIFLLDVTVLGLVLADATIGVAQSVAGLAVFGLLGFWTQRWLAPPLLDAALAFYFIFAVIHSAVPALLQPRREGVNQTGWNHIFPILALALVLVPVFKLAPVSSVVWPFILLIDLLALVLAVMTATLLPVLSVLLLTLAATGILIFKIPADLSGLPVAFFLLGAFVVFFVAASVWLVRKFTPGALKSGITFSGGPAAPGDLAAVLPACSIVLPFLLLIMASFTLPLINPSPLFGLALLLVALLFGITKLFSLDWIPVIGLLCLSALECAWYFNHLEPANASQPFRLILAWYLIFFVVFALFPFVFLKQFSGKVLPWAAAALAGPLQFFLVHRLVAAVYPNPMMGLLPALFAIPGLLSLVVVLQKIPANHKARLAQVAWFGGVALFFITLIFPIQFDRQWITIGWALEGVALLWLFHRVPHPGLRLIGVCLLGAAFARLALNPAVLAYHRRAATPIFNWYLYAYGIGSVCLAAGAKLMAPPRNLLFRENVPPVLAGGSTVLAFLLMNIEIADYFNPPGATLTFQFGGNFAREMTYTIGWALFALVLLVYGIVKKNSAARYAAMGLLCVTLLKLFFHDLAQLGQIYRIGAFVGVAVIAMLASFAYQKFFSAVSQQKEAKNETP